MQLQNASIQSTLMTTEREKAAKEAELKAQQAEKAELLAQIAALQKEKADRDAELERQAPLVRAQMNEIAEQKKRVFSDYIDNKDIPEDLRPTEETRRMIEQAFETTGPGPQTLREVTIKASRWGEYSRRASEQNRLLAEENANLKKALESGNRISDIHTNMLAPATRYMPPVQHDATHVPSAEQSSLSDPWWDKAAALVAEKQKRMRT